MVDLKTCPNCGEKDYVSGSICSSCGYDASMERKIQYTITITAPGTANGTITGATTGDKRPYGDQVVLTFTPNDTNHMQFLSWDISGVEHTENPVTIDILGAISVHAHFAVKKALTVGAHTNGTIKIDGVTKSAGTYYYDNGTSIELEAFPADHCEFLHWHTGNGDNASNPHTVVMTADRTRTPHFSWIQHTLTVVQTDNATNCSVDQSTGLKDEAAELVCTATDYQAGGFYFNFWVWGGEKKTANPLTITIPESDCLLVAVFKYIPP